VQKAWVALDVPQCGFCQSGMIMAAAALLKDKPNPTDADIDAAMTQHLPLRHLQPHPRGDQGRGQGRRHEERRLSIQHADGSLHDATSRRRNSSERSAAAAGSARRRLPHSLCRGQPQRALATPRRVARNQRVVVVKPDDTSSFGSRGPKWARAR
jgi:hypothetical protein